MRIRAHLLLVALALATACGSTANGESDVTDAAETADDTAGPGPTFEVDSPADGAVYLPGAAVPFELRTTCTGCTISASSSLDGPLFSGRPSSQGRLSQLVTDLSPGAHELDLQLLHPDGRVLRAVSQGLRIDRVPGAPTVHLEPALPTTADTLTVVFDSYAVDPDNDAVSYTYRWSRDGQVAVENSSKTLSSSLTARGETWSVTVIPRDPWGEGPSASAQVVIGNSPPAVATVVMLPSVGTADTAFSCTWYDWSDPDQGDPQVPAYAFLKNGQVVGGPGPSPDFPPGYERGDQLVCRVVPSDGASEGTAVDSAPVIIANAAPTVASVVLAPEGGDVTSTFTCTAGSTADADGDPVTLAWRWRVDDVLLAGETSDTLAGQAFARGNRVRCEITPSDGVQDGLPLVSNEVVIADAPPLLVGAMLAPAEATEASVLTCTPGDASDPDGDLVAFRYDWLVDGTPVDEQHGATLTGLWFDKGQGVECAITPEANGLAGAIVFAKSVTQVVNTPPTLAGASLFPGEGGRQTLFTCVTGAFADPDPSDDPAVWNTWVDPQDTSMPGFAYTWTLDGQPVAGADEPTFRPVQAAPGQVLRCRLDVSDGQAAAPPVETEGLALVNHAPTLGDVTLTPDDPTEGSVLLCSANQGIDPDDDAVTLQIEWLLNGQALADASDAQLDGSRFDEGDGVACRVTPVDMYGLAGDARTSPTVVVKNSPPLVADVAISPTQAGPFSTFTCTPTGLLDPDPGDTPMVLYTWWRDGLEVAGAGQATWSVGDATTGETVRCSVVPFDGQVAGPEVYSDLVTLQNQPPTVATVHVSPGTLFVGTPAVCVATGAADPEGQPVSLAFAWWKNSALVDDVTGETLPAERLARGDTVFCVVTPSDGAGSGSPLASLPVTVQNSPPTAFDVAIDPAEPTLTDPALQCVRVTTPTDPDGDPLSYTYGWSLDGGPSLGTEASLPTTGLARCDLVRCRAQADDGAGGTTMAESPAVVVEGTFGARFDGEASRVTIASTPALDSTGALTLEAWVHLPSPGAASTPASRGLAGGSRYALGLLASGAPAFELSTGGAGGGTVTLSSASVLPLGQWVHVAGQWDGATARLFVQGALQAEAPLAGFLVPSGDLVVGAPPFAGDLDDLRLSALARYPADFVPEAPLASDAGTLLLLAFERVASGGLADTGPSGLPVAGQALTEAVGACFESGQPDLPPTAPGVAVTPAAPTVDDDLVCQVTAPSTDPEGGPVAYTVAWLLNGAEQADLAGQWIFPAARTDFCDVVTCRVTPDDGALVGPSREAAVQTEAPIVSEYLKYHAWPGTPDPPESWVAGLPDPYAFAQTFTFTSPVKVLGMRFYLRGTYDTGGGRMRWRYDHAGPYDPDEKHFGTAVPYSTTGTAFQKPEYVVTGWNTYLFPTPITLSEPVVVMWTFGGTGTSSGRRVYFDADGFNPDTRNWVLDGGGQIFKADEYDPAITGDFLIELIIEGTQSGVCP